MTPVMNRDMWALADNYCVGACKQQTLLSEKQTYTVYSRMPFIGQLLYKQAIPRQQHKQTVKASEEKEKKLL